MINQSILKSRWLTRLVDTLWGVSLLTILLSLVFVMLGQQLIATAPQQGERIEYWLSQRLNAEVKIAGVSAEWHFLKPTFLIRELEIYESVSGEQIDPVLSLDFCQFGLDVIRSLWHRQPMLSFFHVDGANIQIEQVKSNPLDLASGAVVDSVRIRGLQHLQKVLSHAADDASRHDLLDKRFMAFSQAIKGLDRLIETHGIVIQDSMVIWRDGDRLVEALIQRATVAKWNQIYHVAADVNLLQPTPVHLVLKSHISGTSLSLDDWQAEIYFKSNPVSVIPWFNHFFPESLKRDWQWHIVDGMLETEVWLSIQEAQLQSVKGELKAKEWVLEKALDASSDEPPRKLPVSINLETLSTQFFWHNQISQEKNSRLEPNHWQLGFYDVRIESMDLGNWWLPEMYLGYLLNSQQKTWRIVLPNGNLNEIGRLAQLPLFSDPLSSQMQAIGSGHVEGRIKEAWLELSKPVSQPSGDQVSWEVAWMTSVVDLGVVAPTGDQYITGVDAFVVAKGNVFALHLDSHNVNFFHPNVFRESMLLDRVQGSALLLQNTEHNQLYHQWTLQSSPIAFITEDLSAQLIMKLEPSLGHDGVPQLWGQLMIGQANAQSVSTYLPAGVMAESLVEWLDESIKAGQLQRGDIVLRMGLTKEPQPAMRSLAMQFDVAEATVDYFPPWPQATQGHAIVHVHNKHVDVELESANILDAQIEPTYIYVGPGLTAKNKLKPPRVQLTGHVTGDARSGMEVLGLSPIKDKLAIFLDTVEIAGPMMLGVELNIPLNPGEDPEPQEVKVDITLDTAQLMAQAWRIQLDQLSGSFEYHSETGVNASKWHAHFFKKPVEGFVSSQELNSGAWQLLVGMTGDAAAKNVAEWLQIPEKWHAISGDVKYAADLRLILFDETKQAVASQVTAAQSYLNVQSDLLGLDVAFPQPFKKLATQSLPLNLRINLDVEPVINHLQLGDWGSFTWQNGELGIDKAHVHLGKRLTEETQLHTLQGTQITGSVPRLDMGEWLLFLQEEPQAQLVETHSLDQHDKTDEKDKEERANMLSRSKLLSNFLTLYKADVEFDQLQWGPLMFDDVSLQIQSQQEQAWSIQWLSPDIDVEMWLPVAYWQLWFLPLSDQGKDINQRFVMELNSSKLNIEWPVDSAHESEEASSSQKELEPVWKTAFIDFVERSTVLNRLLPAANVSLDQVSLNQESWGSWRFQLRPDAQGLQFNQLIGDVKATKVSGDLVWHWLTPNVSFEAKTQFDGKISIPNLDHFFSLWSYPQFLEAKYAEFTLDLSWPDHLIRPSLRQLDGQLLGHLKNGRLINTDADASPVRFIGLLNMKTLMRRLQLDFSDVLGKGLAFDDIYGSFLFKQHILDTQRLDLKGPSAQLSLTGEMDLTSQKLQHELLVTVPVSRSLVLPAAATGGLPAAATAYLIEQVIGDQLDKLTTIKYDVRGTISAPNIQRKGSFINDLPDKSDAL